MADEKNLNEEIADVVYLSDDELDDATGGAMIYPSQRMRATCHDCGTLSTCSCPSAEGLR